MIEILEYIIYIKIIRIQTWHFTGCFMSSMSHSKLPVMSVPAFHPQCITRRPRRWCQPHRIHTKPWQYLLRHYLGPFPFLRCCGHRWCPGVHCSESPTGAPTALLSMTRKGLGWPSGLCLIMACTDDDTRALMRMIALYLLLLDENEIMECCARVMS